MGRIFEFVKGGRKIMVKKSLLGDESFDKEFWENVPPDEKLACAWQIVIDCMILKGTLEELKFKKIITIRTMNNHIIKTISLENENPDK